MTTFTSSRADTEVIMISRCKQFMNLAGMDIVTVDGTNPDLTDPYQTACRWLGISAVTDITEAAKEDEFLVVMELRLLQNMSAHYDDVDIRAGERFVAFNQLAVRMRQRYKDLLETAKTNYGYGEGQLEIGAIGIDINEDGT